MFLALLTTVLLQLLQLVPVVPTSASETCLALVKSPNDFDDDNHGYNQDYNQGYMCMDTFADSAEETIFGDPTLQLGGIRCCSTENSGHRFVHCQRGCKIVDYETAEAICTSDGQRLCSRDELLGGSSHVHAFAGCAYNNHVWSLDTGDCSFEERRHFSSFRRGRGERQKPHRRLASAELHKEHDADELLLRKAASADDFQCTIPKEDGIVYLGNESQEPTFEVVTSTPPADIAFVEFQITNKACNYTFGRREYTAPYVLYGDLDREEPVYYLPHPARVGDFRACETPYVIDVSTFGHGKTRLQRTAFSVAVKTSPLCDFGCGDCAPQEEGVPAEEAPEKAAPSKMPTRAPSKMPTRAPTQLPSFCARKPAATTPPLPPPPRPAPIDDPIVAPPPPKDDPCGSATFEDDDGLVVMEMESFPITGGWSPQTSIEGFRGPGYVVWQGANSFKQPGQGLIARDVKITTTGTYVFKWRSRITIGNDNTEHNDNWLKIDGDGATFFAEKSTGSVICPVGGCDFGGRPKGESGRGFFKVYTNQAGRWSWQSKTSDHDAHDVLVTFAKAGTYTVSISGRSRGHAIDRLVLKHLPSYGKEKTDRAIARELPSIQNPSLTETRCM